MINQNGDSIENLISQQEATAPYITQAGPSEARQYVIVAEKEIFLDDDDIIKAISYCLDRVIFISHMKNATL